MLKWFKSFFKENYFEVGDEIIQDCESWETPRKYRVLDVGKRHYRLMELRGYDDPYRGPDEYIDSQLICIVDRYYNKITSSTSN